MRIAQIARSVDRRRGGQERLVGDLIKILLELGHEVTLITCDEESKVTLDCNVCPVRKYRFPGLPIIPSLNDLNKQLNSKFDICHLHYNALFGELAALACKLRGQTLVTTIHSEMKRGIHKILYDRVQLRTLSVLSEVITCLTDSMKSALVRRGIHKRKVVVINNAMHVKEFRDIAGKLKGEVYAEDDFELLFVGRLEKRKGVEFLLEALHRLKERNSTPKLKIIGEGRYKPNLMSLLKRHDLSSQVIFCGYVSPENLVKSYLHAKCVVIPSLYEGTPNRVAIEALSLGKPVVVTSIVGMEPIISKNLGFAVPPEDPEALAKAIDDILSMNPPKLDRNKVSSVQFAEKYDWTCVIDQIVSLYQNCLQKEYGK